MSKLNEIRKNDISIYESDNFGPLLGAVIWQQLKQSGKAALFQAKDNRDDGRAPELEKIYKLSMPCPGCIRVYFNGLESTLYGSIDVGSKKISQKEGLCSLSNFIGRLGPWVFNLTS